jgi:hypothetical protein
MRVYLKGGMELADPALVQFTHHSLEFALGSLQDHVRTVVVDIPVADSENFRGCSMDVELFSGEKLHVETPNPQLFVAIEAAADALGARLEEKGLAPAPPTAAALMVG